MASKALEASAVVFVLFASFAALSSLGIAAAPVQYHPAAEIYPQGSGSGLDADTVDGQQASAFQARVSGTCSSGNAIRVINADGSVTCQSTSGGSGTVTSVGSGTGLTGGPITTSGTLSIANPSKGCGAGTAIQSFDLSSGALPACVSVGGGGSGTVTSVGTGAGLTGGPITTSGTLSLNINGGAAQACSGTDKVSSIGPTGIVTCTADQTGGGGGVGGSGTGTYLAKWNTGTSLGASGFSESGPGTISGLSGGVGIGGVSTGWYSDGTNLAARFPSSSGAFYVQSPGAGTTYMQSGAAAGGTMFPNGNVGIGNDLAIGTSKSYGTLSTPNRMHIYGAENLYLLNKGGVIVSKAWGGNGNLNVEGKLAITDGTQGAGKVLTSDAGGVASWQAAGGSSGPYQTKCSWTCGGRWSQDRPACSNTCTPPSCAGSFTDLGTGCVATGSAIANGWSNYADFTGTGYCERYCKR
jgi:hypothetical protein